MNTLSRFFKTHGLSIASASRLSGIPYITIIQHVHDKRGISPELTQKYEKYLGIPRSELRPDLWPPEGEKPVSTSIPHEPA